MVQDLLQLHKKEIANEPSYTDNGVGFNSKDTDTKKGLGMKNIESRVSLLNGKYSIGSEIGKGFKIVIAEIAAVFVRNFLLFIGFMCL